MTRYRSAIVVAVAVVVGLAVEQGEAQDSARPRGPADVAETIAQPATAPGPAVLSKRVVRLFDFEERPLGNYEDMPRDWYRIHQPGFPRYTLQNTAFDTAERASGEHSLKFALNGGSAGAVLETGAIAAIPGANYIVSAKVRTADLRHSRAMMVAYFIDDFGRVIEPSIARSPRTINNDAWTTLKIDLRGEHPRAAWIGLQLLLLQPEHFPGAPPRDPDAVSPEVTRQDIGGSAWFDDVTIYQLPRIRLATQTQTHIIRRPDRPHLDVEVRDLTGQKLSAQVHVYDHMGRLVDRMQRNLGGGQSPRWRWSPRLPQLGWYWADLQVHAPAGRVGRRLVAMAWLPESTTAGRAEAGRFVIVAEDLPDAQRDLLPETLGAIGSKGAVLSVWDDDTVLRDQPGPTVPDPLVRRLIDSGYQLTLSLSAVPQELALMARVDRDKPLSLFTGKAELWRQPVEKLLVRYGRDALRWQIGRTGTNEAFWRDDLGVLYPKVASLFARYIAQPAVVLPWSAHDELPDDLATVSGLTMHLPASIRPDRIPDYVATWPESAGELTLAMQTLSPAHYDHEVRAEDLALRMIHAWRAQPDRLAIERPWSSAQPAGRDVLPDPLLAVWSNVAGQLAERRFVGPMHLGEGIECHILEGRNPSNSALVVWNRSAPRSAEARVELFLGEQPEVMDIWGNVAPLRTEGGRHVIPLDTTPRFVRNINVKLARLRAAFRLEPDFAESRFKVHKHELVLANPWPRTLTGRLRITEPKHWRINPRLINFSIPGRDEIRVPLDITFPMSELAGEKHLAAMMEFDADQPHRIELGAPLRIGLQNILMQPSASIEPVPGERGDVVISMMVQNIGDKAESLYAYATAPDQPRQERVISNLQPGERLVKRFRFADCAAPLRGRSLRVGLREMEGPAMLNKLVDVP